MSGPVRANLSDVTAALPSLSSYLDSLPNGLDSYPEARAKASLYRSVLDADAPLDVARLPAPLQHLITEPAPVSSWIPEVHSHAILLAVRDLRFSSDNAFIRFSYDRQRTLFSGRLYRVMLALASPSMLLRTAALRWRSFHRGSLFTVEDANATSARIRVDHPPGLWDGLLADAMAAGLRAVLDLSGAQDSHLSVYEQETDHLRMRGTWNVDD